MATDIGGKLQAEYSTFLMRIIMPVHLTCAVLQALNSKPGDFSTTASWMSSFRRVILPALIFHGIYDFAAFEGAYLTLLFEDSPFSWLLNILSFAVPLLISMCGICYVVKIYRDKREVLENGWRNLDDDEDDINMATSTMRLV